MQFSRAWTEEGNLFIQSELCERGSLRHYMENVKEPLPESLIWDFLVDVTKGLVWCAVLLSPLLQQFLRYAFNNAECTKNLEC